MTRKEKIANGLPKKKKFEEPQDFQIKDILDKEQKSACATINASTLTLLLGRYGTGKTMTACAYALSELMAGRKEKIIISRPTASEENIGFLPGTQDEKMAPFMMPIVRNMYRLVNPKQVDYWLEKKIIEVISLEFFRGITFVDSIAIVDEVQNVSHKQMKTIATRIGENSKLILCGDKAQCDLAPHKHSGLSSLVTFESKHFSIVELTNNHRHAIVEELATHFDKIEESDK